MLERSGLIVIDHAGCHLLKGFVEGLLAAEAFGNFAGRTSEDVLQNRTSLVYMIVKLVSKDWY